MKKLVVILIILFSLVACGEKKSCWKISISAYGWVEERYVYTTEDDVASQVAALREQAAIKEPSAIIFFERASLSESDCR